MSKASSSKQSVQSLVHILEYHGVEDIVFSPGSRNAALVIAFNAANFNCIVVPDERSAAFIALGKALSKQRPVVMVCTSGSAGLNYAPAIAEAYYLRVPLIAITADRPIEWIDQGAGQSIRQVGMYSNYILGSYNLIQEACDEDDLWHNERLINSAINQAIRLRGPVHLNIPFREPLYETTQAWNRKIYTCKDYKKSGFPSNDLKTEIQRTVVNSDKILLLVGQGFPSESLHLVLSSLARKNQLIIFSETCSNVFLEDSIGTIDRNIDRLTDEKWSEIKPDIIISFGGAIISKKLKLALQRQVIREHWHLSDIEVFPDMFKSLSKKIPVSPIHFLHLLNDCLPDSDSNYRSKWQKIQEASRTRHNAFLKKLLWSDLKVFDILRKEFHKYAQIHAANSSSIRYLQLFEHKKGCFHHANRGVSGIDGCSSTAVGSVSVIDGEVLLISGDLAFFYDINAFWNKEIAGRLKVIVINNGGGGIFEIIPGPDKTAHQSEFFVAAHKRSALSVASCFGLDYFKANNESELIQGLKWLSGDFIKPAILEVYTSEAPNAKVLKEYFAHLAERQI